MESINYVLEEITKNEANHDVIIGVPEVDDITEKLLDAINKYPEYKPEKTIEYINSYKWDYIAEKLINHLKI